MTQTKLTDAGTMATLTDEQLEAMETPQMLMGAHCLLPATLTDAEIDGLKLVNRGA